MTEYRMPRHKTAIATAGTLTFAAAAFAVGGSNAGATRAFFLAGGAFLLVMTAVNVRALVRAPVVLRVHDAGFTFFRPAVLRPKQFDVRWGDLTGISEVESQKGPFAARHLNLFTTQHVHVLHGAWFRPALDEVRAHLLASGGSRSTRLVSDEEVAAVSEMLRLADVLDVGGAITVRFRVLQVYARRIWLAATALTVAPLLASGEFAVVGIGIGVGIVSGIRLSPDTEIDKAMDDALLAPAYLQRRAVVPSDVVVHMVLATVTVGASLALGAYEPLADSGPLIALAFAAGATLFYGVRASRIRKFEREQVCTLYAAEPIGLMWHRELLRGPLEADGSVVS